MLAGWGRYPIVVAEALRRQGHRIYGLGIKDHADPELARLCDDFRMIGIAKLGGQIRFFRRHGVSLATMAGKVFKDKILFHGHWMRHFPDWKCLRTFFPHLVARTRDAKDDSLLGAVVQAYAAEGIVFAPATQFAPELLVRLGSLCGSQLTTTQQMDIEFGWGVAKELGRLDIGQSVAVKGQVVLAVEAVEGTDACIRRAGELCPQGGFVVVKTAKPQQDMRFDVPTIGCGTIETLAAAKAAVLAVEAGKTIILDEPQFLRLAARHRLQVAAISAPLARAKVG